MKKIKRAQAENRLKMTLQGTRQLPIKVQASRKGDMRVQFAALCWRVKNGKPQVLLVTSRGTGRWIIPKGWPMGGTTPCAGALQEAWEEAGVEGKGQDRSLGLFSYLKKMGGGVSLPCVAMVFPVKVTKLAKDFPEAGQRKRKWFSLKRAASLVQEPELAHIIESFDPRLLKR